MNITVRTGRKEDVPAVLELIKELALFEKAPHEVINTVEDMIRDGFGNEPVYRLLIAEADGVIAGIAIFFIKYSTWKGKGVYLDDIVVKEELRGKGIGGKLFSAVIEESMKLEAKQLHWQVLDWNEPAIGFYKKYDAALDIEWINCKLTEQQIKNFNNKQ